jgi:hypothetical protein
MTYPRAQLVDRHNPGFYHVMSRCVRRAHLCGEDPLTGRSYDHRKNWIEEQIHHLAQCFAVDVYAYAVMSNHYHLVLRVDPPRARTWGDAEVAERWLRRLGELDSVELETRQDALCADPERIACLRARLGDLSWFMRCLNEPIARRANREDACTGRFWEGRFQSKALLDERAVLVGMAYADLNPIRAGVTRHLQDSAHTSIRWRLQHQPPEPDTRLHPVAGETPAVPVLGCTYRDYLQLVDWSGRQLRPGRGHISSQAPPLLATLGATSPMWIADVRGLESRYWRAVGSTRALAEKAAQIGQKWLKGLRSAAC